MVKNRRNNERKSDEREEIAMLKDGTFLKDKDVPLMQKDGVSMQRIVIFKWQFYHFIKII